jgi:hypothetical protein
MTADELAEFRAMLTQHREDHAGCHVHCDGFGCHEVIRLMETLSAALQRAEAAEGKAGRFQFALAQIADDATDVIQKESIAITALTREAALAAAGEGGGT